MPCPIRIPPQPLSRLSGLFGQPIGEINGTDEAGGGRFPRSQLTETLKLSGVSFQEKASPP